MTKATDKHIAAIRSGFVERTNVIGLRKALNAHERIARGYSVSSIAPRLTADERDTIFALLLHHSPRVTGQLHVTGKALLSGKRYKTRLASVADIIADLDHFKLTGFDYIGQYGDKVTPEYRAFDSLGNSFAFTNQSWQSGGNGPEVYGVTRNA